MAAIGLGALALLIIGFFLYQAVFNAKPPIDKVSLCPPRIDSVTAVLVDATDELSQVQRAAIESRIAELRDVLPVGGRIDMYLLNTDKALPDVQFSKCNPGTGETASIIDQNPRLVQKKWEQDFSAKLAEVLAQLMTASPSDTSPILEAIQAISLRSFAQTETRGATSKNLIIVSDMIQHTPELSQFKAGPTLDAKFVERTEYFRKVKPNLRGAEVTILYIRRATRANAQGREHLAFWEAIIKTSGGRLVHFVPVEG